MNNRPVILVTGATGAQGGSVARTLLRQNKFAVRILTRNAASAKALELKYEGAEIAEADLENTNSLLKAMQGVYGVFGVTSYWEHFEKEYGQGKNLVDAVKQAGIQHFVFSTLPNYNKLSQAKYIIPQYDTKAMLQEYTKSLGIPASFIHVSFYYENLLKTFPLQKDEKNNFWFGFPQGYAPLPMVSVEDVGGIVAKMFEHPKEYIGRKVQAVGANQACDEYAEILSSVLKRKICYKYIPREEYAANNMPHAEEIANTFEVQRIYSTDKLVDLIESNGLYPEIQNFKTWVIKNKAKFQRLINNQIEVMVD